MKTLFIAGLAAVFSMVAVDWAEAQRGGGGMGRGGGMGMRGGKMGMQRERMDQEKPPYATYEQKGLFATDIKPIFPEGVSCPEIASPFGSTTRYDGSHRNNDHYGYHNGMDISLNVGTPLIAVADGEVVHTGSAGQLVGNYIWVRYSPEATGLPIYTFIRYQHLNQNSPLSVGDMVKMGDTLGPSGNTGTTGGHFGHSGYPHLHMNILFGPSPEFTTRGAMLGPKDLRYLDPMGLYIKKPVAAIDNHILKALPDSEKSFPVAVKTTDGRIIPEGAEVVWPVMCEAN